MLNRLDFGPEKEPGGTYKVTLPKVPKTVHFRFANKYLYASFSPESITKDKLLDPGAVLPAETAGSISSTSSTVSNRERPSTQASSSGT